MDCVLKKLDELPELRPFPAMATKVLSAVNDANTSPSELTQLITCEPSIALRILKVANSPAYGFTREIHTVDQAVVILGNKAIRDLVLTVSTGDLFAAGTGAEEAREILWNHSLACATVAGILATRTPDVSKDEAFLAGILHDVGKLVFYDVAPSEYTRIDSGCNSQSIIDSESDTFGINHQELGQRCSEEWGLPDEVHDVIGFHHSPAEADFAPDLTRLVSLANSLSREWELGCRFDTSEASSCETAKDALGLDDEQLNEIRSQAEGDFEVLRNACTS